MSCTYISPWGLYTSFKKIHVCPLKVTETFYFDQIHYLRYVFTKLFHFDSQTSHVYPQVIQLVSQSFWYSVRFCWLSVMKITKFITDFDKSIIEVISRRFSLKKTTGRPIKWIICFSPKELQQKNSCIFNKMSSKNWIPSKNLKFCHKLKKISSF